jgi:hypothetical protein
MGMYDSVLADCPTCGKSVEFQSNEGPERMAAFSLDNAPTEIIRDIANDPHYCRGCGNWFALVDPAFPPGPPQRPQLRTAKVKTPPDATIHRSQTFLRWWPDDRPFTYDDLEDPVSSAT